METTMSAATRKELLKHIKERYREAHYRDKSKILDEFCTLTSYGRKYAINLFNSTNDESNSNKVEKRLKNKKYDEALRQALLTIWNAANQICSKRLVPFIPELLGALERFGHVSLPEDVRVKLLTISSATVDRLLETERREGKKGLCTTTAGSLLKKQIKIRTFADWNDVVPGFLEGDLVAHCGMKANGAYLNTLVVTDIASTWTEFFPILVKGEINVIAALKVAQKLLPFPFLGLDTDNGSEFINYALLEFCKSNSITFTRSRAYKKNDQAHVEEKNGSIIRRLIGYDRYEGIDAYNALSELYAVLRLYVNFFQPSLKLLSKKREGAKVTKQYDKAKTPYQRLMLSLHLTEIEKEKLKAQYDTLDPIDLLSKLVKLQDNFWTHAWKPSGEDVTVMDEINNLKINEAQNITNDAKNIEEQGTMTQPINSIETSDDLINSTIQINQQRVTGDTTQSPSNIRRYRRTAKPRKDLGPRTWLTREDAFLNEWEKIKVQLELNPAITAKKILVNLIEKDSKKFKIGQLRTLQRRISKWQVEQLKLHQEMQSKKSPIQDASTEAYVLLIAQAVFESCETITEVVN